MLKKIKTSLLEMAYEENGAENGAPVILMHGFPDGGQTWNAVTEQLSANGFRTFAVYTRGYGGTRFLDKDTMRSGEGVAYAQDIIEFADALGLEKFTFVGHDWGAIAAYTLGILYPERLDGMVAASVGYESALPDAADKPMPIPQIRAYWYQWHFNTPQGPETLAVRRDELCRDMWRVWSPDWNFTEEEFQKTAQSWNNPDFQSIVIHSYRVRYKNAAGDSRYKDFEPKLLGKPKIAVPTIVLHGERDGASLAASSENQEHYFTSFYERRPLSGIGHFLTREQPEAVVKAVLDLSKSKQQARGENA